MGYRTAFVVGTAMLAALGIGAPGPSPFRDARQLLVVVTGGWDAVPGMLRQYERSAPSAAWIPAGPPVRVVVGRAGLGWGLGVAADPSVGGPRKTEGDDRAPAGAFRIGTAFGRAAVEPAGIRLHYLPLGDNVECVDDPRSAQYNRLVTRTSGNAADWTSSEKMWLEPLYRLGALVDHNTSPIRPGAGSCIFLHIWSGPDGGTAGCTAMAEGDLETLLRWIDPARRPVLVQLPEVEYRRLRHEWQLPG